METLRPYSLLCELTYRCPLQCPYCSNPLAFASHMGELTTAEWQRVFSEAAALGVVQAHFSGGEPLLRADAPAIIRHARDLGLYTNLSTGGTLLTEALAGELRAAGLDCRIPMRKVQTAWLAALHPSRKKFAPRGWSRPPVFP